MTAIQKFIATIGALLIIGGGIYYFSTRSTQIPQGVDQTATTTANGVSTTTIESTGGTTTVTLKQPDYKKPINFAANISADIRTQLNSGLVATQAEITKNPLNLRAWTNLGNLHKIGGDYQNAALYWEYVTSIFRGSGAPLYSLGDLYDNFLHDYAKAEINYQAAIKADPKNVTAYASLYTMYHYTLKDDTKAAAILEQGLKANPGNNYLLGLQQELQAK